MFHVTSGRYLFEVDGKRFHAEAGDVVFIPGGAAHGFVNVTDAPASQFGLILPGVDAVAFFNGMHAALAGGSPDRVALEAFGLRWNVDLLGSLLKPD